METKLLKEINTVLSGFPEYWEEDNLLKAKVINDLREYNSDLIESLLNNNLINKTYSLETRNGLVFKINEFIDMLRYKTYWDNSYTKFSTEIGLASDNRYLKYNTDVVLDFPYKDCVLEGGMTQEAIRKKEIYYHKTIAKDEIDVMLSPKVFLNAKKYDENGSHDVQNFDDTDNLIIKGNNLIALHSLKERYNGRCKLVFIDPPYFFNDTKNDDTFGYNSNFKLSTWLTFLKSRIEVARELMSEDGSIWISIDDDGAHYLKVLCDGIFGAKNFVNNVVWEKKFSPQNDATWLSDSHDHVLVYAKNKDIWRPNLLLRSEAMDKRYSNPDNDPRGPWTSGDLSVKTYSAKTDYTIITPSGREVDPPPGYCWRVSNEKLNEMIKDNRIWFGNEGKNVPRIKRFLSEVKKGITAMTIWKHSEVGNNQEAKREVNALEDVDLFSTPKPERLLQRIIHLGSNENDIVLDFFMGSATTQAVSMKMNRQFIGVEQMEYVSKVSVPRLVKVIKGEQGGVSKDTSWNGGGGFVYVELLELNQQYISRIINAKTSEEIDFLIRDIKEYALLDYKINMGRLTNSDDNFASFNLEEKKKLLIESLDCNQMYLAYSEIDDSQFAIPESTKLFNHSFYSKFQGGE